MIGKRCSLRIFCKNKPRNVTWCRSGDSNLCFPPHRECNSVSKLMNVQEEEGIVPEVVFRSDNVEGVHSSCRLTWTVNKGTLSIVLSDTYLRIPCTCLVQNTSGFLQLLVPKILSTFIIKFFRASTFLKIFKHNLYN
jgi:hypothetical protein